MLQVAHKLLLRMVLLFGVMIILLLGKTTTNAVAIVVSKTTMATTTKIDDGPPSNNMPEEEELEQMMKEIRSHMIAVRSLLDHERDSKEASERHDHNLSLQQEEIIDKILAEQEESDEIDLEEVLTLSSRESSSSSETEDDEGEEVYSLSPEQQRLVDELLFREDNNNFEMVNDNKNKENEEERVVREDLVLNDNIAAGTVRSEGIDESRLQLVFECETNTTIALCSAKKKSSNGVIVKSS